MAFSRIVPLGDEVARATLEATVAVANCWLKRPLCPEDFLPARRERWREQTPAEQRAILGAAVAMAQARAKG